MQNKIFLLITATFLVVSACTKKQRNQNRIGGKWRLVEKTLNGTTVDLKGKDYYTNADSASAFEYATYAFSKNGKELSLMYRSNSVEIYEVKKLTRNNMELNSKRQNANYKFNKEKDAD
jgi:uncharacterized protein YxeA